MRRRGTTTIAHEDSPDKLTVVQTLKTESGARTMTVDPKTHKIYLLRRPEERTGQQFQSAGVRDAKALSCCNR